MPHAAGRTLYDHLTGCAAIAAAWRQSGTVRRAALFHSIYGTNVYRDAAAADAGRAAIAAAIGDDAERLAWLFGVLDRARFREAIGAMRRPEACTVVVRFDASAALEARDVESLVMLGMINEIEQTCAADGSPASWRARCPSLVAAVLRWRGCGLPERVRRALDVPREEERATIEMYARAIAMRETDPSEAMRCLESAGASALHVAEPYIMLAEIAGRARDASLVDRFATEALARSAVWGTTWDKRASFEMWQDRIGRVESIVRELDGSA